MMMRATAWITVLVGLFMFQSLWNVAAAFCVHEDAVQLQQSYHFGHHQNSLCPSASGQQHATEQSKQLKSINGDLPIGEEHQDHLPSMTQLYVPNNELSAIPLLPELKVIPQFYWINRYQAPDLFQQSPPPEFSPLMVG
jgi:hypothetical protein